MISKQLRQSVDCQHCGLPVPPGMLNPLREEQFCCQGCATAFQLIRDNGLESYYSMLSDFDSGERSLKDRAPSASLYADFDSQEFQKQYANRQENGVQRIQLALDGIHCAACVWLIEKLPNILPGIASTRVNLARGTVQLVWQQSQTPLSVVARKLAQLGYPPHAIRESERAKRFQGENRRQLSRIGIAAALAGNNMIISAALYLGMFSHMTSGMSWLLRVSSCVVGLASLVFPGRIFLASAFHALRTRTPHMDLPIALALLAGTLVGTWNVLRGAGEIYFDSLAVLIFLLLVGRWLQFRQQAKAADAVEMLTLLTPRCARKIDDQGNVAEVFVDSLAVGDRVEVLAGDLIPIDGTIRSGRVEIDEAILTGESHPVIRDVGDEVSAGTTNLNSRIVIEATAVGKETQLNKIAELVEQSSMDKPAIVQWANKIGAIFLVAVMLSAITAFLFWLSDGLDIATDHAIALLIVACPCALALATPLAISVALGRAAKSRIMVKGGDVFQLLQRPGVVWLDKTGTLTEGKLRVENWMGERSWLKIAGELERNSKHPMAQAIVRFLDERLDTAGIPQGSPPQNCREVVGGGMTGEVDGKTILVGNRHLLSSHGIHPEETQVKKADRWVSDGYSICWVAAGAKVVAMLALADKIREDSKSAINHLAKRGWQVGILSGDQQAIVDQVASELGIDTSMALGELRPKDKLQQMKTGTCGTVVMVGDGVNDSAALAGADVGMAVKNGAEASLAAAPVYLAKPGLGSILELMRIADSTARTMRRNLTLSLGYNLCFAGLAFAGLINPLVAAILMPVSSLSVVSMSLTAGRIRKRERKEA